MNKRHILHCYNKDFNGTICGLRRAEFITTKFNFINNLHSGIRRCEKCLKETMIEKIRKKFYKETNCLLNNKFNEFEQQAIWDWIETQLKKAYTEGSTKMVMCKTKSRI